MTLNRFQIIAFCSVVACGVWLAKSASGQVAKPSTANVSEDAARRQILASDRWRRTRRDFDEWLEVQRIYTANEAAAIRAKLAERIETSSPRELEDLLDDMDDRLDVLMSPAAEDARQWVAQFLATARNAEAQIRDKRPDVMNMSAREIRQELERFHERRGSQRQAQAAFDAGRALRVESAQSARAANRQSQDQLRDSRSRAAANAQNRSTVPPADRPNFSEPPPADQAGPAYAISPWGTPIRWNAFHAENR